MAGVPADVDAAVLVDARVIEPVPVSASEVHLPPASRARAATSRRAPKRRPPSPAKMFAPEIQAGQVPSLRLIKSKMHVGTDRARAIRDELAAILEAQPAAA